MIALLDYASPSFFESTRDQTALAFATNRRRPVRFHGVVREHGFLLRIALRTLGEVIWSHENWRAEQSLGMLDPIITVHPDRLCFEAFSQDQSVYAALLIDPSLFALQEPIVAGTTNIDFTAWLWGAIGEMRTSRQTTFRIGPEGLDVRTTGAGGRFERKVEVPANWVRGFLQVQAAMAMPGTRLEVSPIDLLSALRFLRYTKAKVSPRALRYEFEPGQEARLVLEPWEEVVPLVGAKHDYTQRKVTRVWGRRRLRHLEGLLPFADSVQVYLKGRGLPSFYAVKFAGLTFLLGLSGVSEANYGATGGFDLLQDSQPADEPMLDLALDLLRREHHASIRDVSLALGVNEATATRVLVRLCRQGRAMFDIESRHYRHRELFEQPANELEYFPPDLRRELATQYQTAGRVQITSCTVEPITKIKNLKTPLGTFQRQIVYRDWQVVGSVAEIPEVRVVVNDSGSIIFGRCSCAFFDTHLLQRGPCEHILALYQASSERRVDSATSTPIATNLSNNPFESQTTFPSTDDNDPNDEPDDV